MVERFNRTLEAMLSSVVNKNHTDWDEQLPYLMMAYRSAEHDTTGYSPNYLMLGREATTPLDLVYEMNVQRKPIPRSKWVWQLQETMEEAHRIVRDNTQGEMMRQKRYHDRKLQWQRFSPGDSVYVYFPRKRMGTSPKLTSFWQGPFEVLQKCSDYTYLVSCGFKGSSQVIHVDRMRLVKPQLLAGEGTFKGLEPPQSDEFDTQNYSVAIQKDEIEDDKIVEENYPRLVRNRRAPAYLSDYVVDMYD
uniref:Uncharacterized protein LOC111101945 n=1 Tax=Crassostrea virginica TaxID=6565 RepID=A0A8B8AG12_CRAVI|nr:uncharacterized protein LOC111101945 [Crassostrea virginica]